MYMYFVLFSFTDTDSMLNKLNFHLYLHVCYSQAIMTHWILKAQIYLFGSFPNTESMHFVSLVNEPLCFLCFSV